MNILEISEIVFNRTKEKELHVNDIAKSAMSYGLVEAMISQEDLASKISSALSSNVKSSKSIFKKFKNKQGGLRKGIYGLKQKRIVIKQVEIPKVSTQYTGKGGEYAVLGELLFNGFNASLMSVDDGIDVIASKSNKFFHIQVKTCYESNNSFSFSIKQTSFNRYNAGLTYYIIVLRNNVKGQFINKFAILSSHVISGWIEQKIIKNTDNISVKISLDSNCYKINNKIDITSYIGAFDIIK